MKLSTLRVYLAMYAIACGASNVSAMQSTQSEIDAQNAALARLGDAGLMPHMASIPTSGTLRSSGDRIYCQGTCIPSSPVSCNGSCCRPYTPLQSPKASANLKRLELPQESAEREENIRKLKDLMKKIVQVVGRTEAIKIAKIALDESSDSDDTGSSESLNSPDGGHDDDVLAELKNSKK